MSKPNFGDSNFESQRKSYFKTKPLNEWMEEAKSLPKTLPLFGSIWHSGELAICFADTGLGKSILLYSLFESITSNRMFLNMETTYDKVHYFDFELSSQSVYLRYSDLSNNSHYDFDENFVRSEINLDTVDLTDTSSGNSLFKYIEEEIFINHAKIVCIDNISFISTDNEKNRFATQLMKSLLQLTRKHGISVLVLAHEPKEDKNSNKLNLNRLAGAKSLSNYADVVFALGKPAIWGIIYLKELKNRNREIVYHENNVLAIERIKKGNFLTFQVIGCDSESNMIDFKSSDDRNMKILKMSSEGISNVRIGEEFGISEGAVRKILKKMQE